MEKELDELIAKYEEGNMSLITLKAELLRLFSVAGQSEQFKCHSCGTYHTGKNDDQLFEVCKTCFDGI